ncbi:hypothetical protein, partial [Leucobacter komagatae]|uniref:hypothetical protein n=1 Tax=Leucobacter komagatae TaxID=55969 RepID=UPI001E4F7E00
YRGGDRNDRQGGGDRAPYRGGDRNDRQGGGDRKPFRGDRETGGTRPPFRGDRDDRGGRQDTDSRGRGGTRGGGRSDRGGQEREFTEEERLQHSLRPVRSEHDDPIIAEHIQPSDLHPSARNELKTLQPEVQERVSLHLAMVAELIEDDPELAHQHAISASRRAGRIPVTRETLAITAYRTGDFALAIRELRTFRRLSGRDSHLAIMVDSERGLGRPEKAIETGLEVDVSTLETADRVRLAIAMSGARLDLGQTQQALFELEIPELDPKTGFSWSPELFGAYATVLEDLGRDDEAAVWFAHADRAQAALEEHFGGLDEIEVIEITEYEDLHDEDLDDEDLDDEDLDDEDLADEDLESHDPVGAVEDAPANDNASSNDTEAEAVSEAAEAVAEAEEAEEADEAAEAESVAEPATVTDAEEVGAEVDSETEAYLDAYADAELSDADADADSHADADSGEVEPTAPEAAEAADNATQQDTKE